MSGWELDAAKAGDNAATLVDSVVIGTPVALPGEHVRERDNLIVVSDVLVKIAVRANLIGFLGLPEAPLSLGTLGSADAVIVATVTASAYVLLINNFVPGEPVVFSTPVGETALVGWKVCFSALKPVVSLGGLSTFS